MVARLCAFSAMIISITHTMLLKTRLQAKYFLMILLKVLFLQIVLDIKARTIRIFNPIILLPKNTSNTLIGKGKTCGQVLIKTEIFILFLMKQTANIIYTLL